MGVAGIRSSGKRPDFTPIGSAQLEKELRGAELVIDDLRATINIAQHDVFKAEVEMRRAQQKRRNQKIELKRLHGAVNERNNRIRNLELEIAALRGEAE